MDSKETLDFRRIAPVISQESGYVGEIAWARLVLGFSLLRHGSREEAGRKMHAAPLLAGQTGDVVHQSRCLIHLTVLYGKRALLEPTQQRLPGVVLAVVEKALDAWRGKDLEDRRTCLEQALESAQQLGYL